MPSRDIIFAIDDDPDVVEMYANALNKAFNVQTFTSAKDALKALVDAKKRPIAMLIDLIMPEMDGIQLVQELRGRSYINPIIICSGHADKEKSIKALSLRVFALLEKPFYGPELVNITKHAVYEFKITDINRRLLQLGTELSNCNRDLLILYEKRLAAAENIMFNMSPVDEARNEFMDHNAYYDQFAQLSRTVEELNWEIGVLHKEQERLIEWSQRHISSQ